MSDLAAVITAAIAPASAAAAAAETAAAVPAAEPVVADVVADVPEPEVDSSGTPIEPAEPAEPEVEGATPAAPVVAPPVVEPVVPPVEDDFATEHGIKSKDTAGRENRIPYSAVKRINANAVKKATDALTATHTAAVAEQTTKLTQYEERLNQVAEVERMMFDEPAKFFEILKTLPGYAELLVPTPVDTPPGPDVEGGYTPEGLQALLAWHTAKATAEASKAAEARLTKRYGPIEARYKREEETAQLEAKLAPKIQAQLDDARTNWLGYKENEAEIQKTYLADKTLTLEAAWRKVMVPKLTADRTKMRTEILAELAAAPKSTALTPGAAPTTAARTKAAEDPNAPMDLAATVRRSIAGLKR